LLEIAAQQGRIVISHDRRTMTRHFRDRLSEGKSSPGLFIVRPGFKSEESERQFWAKRDSTQFIDWSSGSRRKMPKLKPSCLQKERGR
jgi:hypothetical protein